jgi:hypothetical protein
LPNLAAKQQEQAVIAIMVLMFCTIFVVIGYSYFTGKQEGDSCSGKDDNAEYEYNDKRQCKFVKCVDGYAQDSDGVCVVDQSGEDCVGSDQNAVYETDILGECEFVSCESGYELGVGGTCVTTSAPPSPSPSPSPQNCVATPNAWGACSATCGGGTQTRGYTITTSESGGGTCPERSQTDSQDCNTQDCPPSGSQVGTGANISDSTGSDTADTNISTPSGTIDSGLYYMYNTNNNSACWRNPSDKTDVRCVPDTPGEYLQQFKFEYTGDGNNYFISASGDTQGYCGKSSFDCDSDKNGATKYEILESGSNYTIKNVDISKYCYQSGNNNLMVCDLDGTSDKTSFKLELTAPIEEDVTFPAATPFEDRAKNELPSGISGYVDALEELSPIVAGENMGKCLGQTQSINSSGGYYCGKLTGDDANNNKNYAKGIYPTQETNYTSNASFRKSVAGHWVAKQNNVDCSDEIDYSEAVGATCYLFDDEIVKIRKASKNKFNTVSKAKNCPVLYYKTVAANEC